MTAERTGARSESRDRSPHISSAEKRHLLAALDRADEPDRAEIMTRLAWRPAWAIRSRGGALSEFLGLFGIGKDGGR